MASEQAYYGDVRRFLLTGELDCAFATSEVSIRTAINVPNETRGGRVDVVGLRKNPEAAGTYGLISIEVKPDWTRLLTKMGQALAYSVVAHACYLAVPFAAEDPESNRFQEDEIRAAQILGVGLIEIQGVRDAPGGPAHPCRIVCPSKLFSPDWDLFSNAFRYFGREGGRSFEAKCEGCHGTRIAFVDTKRVRLGSRDDVPVLYPHGLRYPYVPFALPDDTGKQHPVLLASSGPPRPRALCECPEYVREWVAPSP